MEQFYKAVRPDGKDFYSGTVDYASLCGTGEWLPELPGGDCCTGGVYHASTTAADTLIGGSWPCRLFLVEGEPVSQEDTKRGFKTLRVIEELPAWQAFGPNGEAVIALIEKAGILTDEEIRRSTTVMAAAWFDARAETQYAARATGRIAAWYAIGDATCNTVGSWAESFSAGMALLVKDLISADSFNTLYGPWAALIGETDQGIADT